MASGKLHSAQNVPLPFGVDDIKSMIGRKVWNVLGTSYWPILGGDDQSSFAWLTYDPPGSFIPPHTHPIQDEHVFVLEGEYSLYMDGEWVTAKPGDHVCWPRGSSHGYRIEADKPARGLFWVSPGNDLSTLFDELHNQASPEEVVRLSGLRNILFAKPGTSPNFE